MAHSFWYNGKTNVHHLLVNFLVVKIYKQQGFKVTHILLDGDFAALEIQLNLVSNAEHVPEVE
jgi:hypothetical protein